jgi:hypothetical protein
MTTDWGRACDPADYVEPELDAGTLAWCEVLALGRTLATSQRQRLDSKMGAEVFSSRAAGKDADEAFQAAVKQAEWDYGHAGYTGSIAEKDDFVLVVNEPMEIGAAAAFADQLINDDDERVTDKWGPAGCIPLDDGTFYFFGWSSS